MLLTRDQILGAKDTEFEDVPVPEWARALGIPMEDAKVRIQSGTGDDKDTFEASCIKERRDGRKVTKEAHMAKARAKLVAMAAVDETGKRIFIPGDVDLLGKKNAAALDRCFKVAMRLWGMTEDEVENLGKDSESSQSDDSSSALLLA
jgi:hypothetical protein